MRTAVGGILGGVGRRLSRRGRPGEPPCKMQPPLTPMIDVTFLLLLFFLLATTFRQAEGQIAGALPQRMDAVTLDRNIIKPIRIAILPADGDGGAVYRLATGESFAGPDELFAKLASLRRAYGSDQVPVAIQPRWDVPWQYVVEADNQAQRAGFRTVGIASPT